MNTYWNALRIMYFGLLGGTLIYLGVVLAMSQSLDLNFNINEFTANILNTLGIVIGFGAYFGVRQIDAMQLKKLDQNWPIVEKLHWFKNTLIMEVAILEGASFIIITFFLITKSYLSITGLILTIPYMILLRPDIYKVSEVFKVSKDEIEKVENVIKK